MDDGADYDDCLEGYTDGVLDEATGVLTLRFRRHEDAEAENLDPDDDWASAEYRFELVEAPVRPSDEHLQRAVTLLARFVAEWGDAYVAPPTGQDEAAAKAARGRLSLTHQNAERLLAAMGVDVPEVAL